MPKRRSQASELRSLVADLVNQFALMHTYKGRPVRSTGCLSDLEAAFRVMGLPDPCPEEEWHGAIGLVLVAVGVYLALGRPWTK